VTSPETLHCWPKNGTLQRGSQWQRTLVRSTPTQGSKPGWACPHVFYQKKWYFDCTNTDILLVTGRMSTLCIVLAVPKYKMTATFKQHKLHSRHFSRKPKRKYYIWKPYMYIYTQQFFQCRKWLYVKHQVLSDKYLMILKKLTPWMTDVSQLKMWVANLQKNSSHLSKA
jgi:hypothetical protein